ARSDLRPPPRPPRRKSEVRRGRPAPGLSTGSRPLARWVAQERGRDLGRRPPPFLRRDATRAWVPGLPGGRQAPYPDAEQPRRRRSGANRLRDGEVAADP